MTINYNHFKLWYLQPFFLSVYFIFKYLQLVFFSLSLCLSLPPSVCLSFYDFEHFSNTIAFSDII